MEHIFMESPSSGTLNRRDVSVKTAVNPDKASESPNSLHMTATTELLVFLNGLL